MNIRHIQWAMQHDWYIRATTSSIDGTLTVTVRDDMYSGILLFHDFKALYEWAGY